MLAKDLIAALKAYPDAEIVMASDAEGNSFHQADAVSLEVGAKFVGSHPPVSIEDPLILWPVHGYLEDETPEEED